MSSLARRFFVECPEHLGSQMNLTPKGQLYIAIRGCSLGPTGLSCRPLHQRCRWPAQAELGVGNSGGPDASQRVVHRSDSFVSGRISVSETFVFTSSYFLFGPCASTLTVALDVLVCSNQSSQRRTLQPIRVLFNISSASLSIWVASNLFYLASRESSHLDRTSQQRCRNYCACWCCWSRGELFTSCSTAG